MAERCDWNPEANEPAIIDGPGCQNTAELSVGANGDWHLCPSCADLPAFKKYRARTPLRRAASQAQGSATHD